MAGSRVSSPITRKGGVEGNLPRGAVAVHGGSRGRGDPPPRIRWRSAEKDRLEGALPEGRWSPAGEDGAGGGLPRGAAAAGRGRRGQRHPPPTSSGGPRRRTVSREPLPGKRRRRRTAAAPLEKTPRKAATGEAQRRPPGPRRQSRSGPNVRKASGDPRNPRPCDTALPSTKDQGAREVGRPPPESGPSRNPWNGPPGAMRKEEEHALTGATPRCPDCNPMFTLRRRDPAGPDGRPDRARDVQITRPLVGSHVGAGRRVVEATSAGGDAQ